MARCCSTMKSWQSLSSSSVVTPGATWEPIMSSTSAARRPATRIFCCSSGDLMVIGIGVEADCLGSAKALFTWEVHGIKRGLFWQTNSLLDSSLVAGCSVKESPPGNRPRSPTRMDEENSMPSVSMRQMLEAGVHFGHQTRFWNPRMAQYIFGERNRIHIINLEKTQPLFADATKFVRQLAANRGTILMVGTKRQARETVATEAKRAGVPYVDQRWLGGMLTNFKTVKTSIKRLKDMKAQQEGGLEAMSKKEQLMFAREMEKLEKDIGGIQDMTSLPDAIFVIDVGFHKIAVSEAKKLGIPLVGVVDTNHSPIGIDYVIPGNDDSSKAVTLYARGIADAILEGRSSAVTDVVKAVAEGG